MGDTSGIFRYIPTPSSMMKFGEKGTHTYPPLEQPYSGKATCTTVRTYMMDVRNSVRTTTTHHTFSFSFLFPGGENPCPGFPLLVLRFWSGCQIKAQTAARVGRSSIRKAAYPPLKKELDVPPAA